ncbi:putative membrane protein [Bradyrhizobium sp. AZCC 2262]|uniref:hypothetical protein n=1 Tax=Bradyrhizobium sp. AZCC 2262 TaxID=3117022 RepID=UPI002FF30A5A
METISERSIEITILLTVIVIITGIVLMVVIPQRNRSRYVMELMKDPAIQARLKDTSVDFAQLLHAIRDAERATPTPPRDGIMDKVIADITWDVSGLIGMVVTLVICYVVLFKNPVDIPRELLAGWTTILGFYFGRAKKVTTAGSRTRDADG